MLAPLIHVLLIWSIWFLVKKLIEQTSSISFFLHKIDHLGTDAQRKCFSLIVGRYWLQNKKRFVDVFFEANTVAVDYSDFQKQIIRNKCVGMIENFQVFFIERITYEINVKKSSEFFMRNRFFSEDKKILIEILEESRKIFDTLQNINETDKKVSAMPETYERMRLDHSVSGKRYELIRRGYYHDIFQMLG